MKSISIQRIFHFSRGKLLSATLLLVIYAHGAGIAASEGPKESARANSEKPAAAEKKTERTLEEIVSQVLREGKDKNIDADTARNLGFDDSVPIRSMRFRKEVSPDGQEHALTVVYRLSQEKTHVPVELVWRITKVVKGESGKFVSGMDFRSSLDGKLKAAVWANGKVGEVEQSVVPVGAEETQRDFKKEIEFFLATAARIPLKK